MMRANSSGPFAIRRYPLFLCLGLLLIATAGPAHAQSARWTAHTSMRGVVALSVSDDALWAASTGGVFSYMPATGEFRRFTASEGLNNVQTQAVAYDARRGAVWIGYGDGALDRLDLDTGNVRTFLDIARNERFTMRGINHLTVRGDSLLVATDFGLLIFDPERGEVRATYSRFGTLPPAAIVRDVLVTATPAGATGFWVATSEGVAYAPLDAPNLQDPQAWTAEQAALPSRDAYALARFGGALYVGTDVGLARRLDDGSYDLLGFTDRTIFDLVSLGERLMALDDFRLYSVFSNGGSLLSAEGSGGLRALAVGPNGNLWMGGLLEGLNGFERPAGNDPPAVLLAFGFPEGPFDGLFGALTTDAEGNLWAAAVAGTPGGGIYKLDPQGEWTSYVGRFFPELTDRGPFTVLHAGSQGSLWAGSNGNGLAQVLPDGSVRVYDQENSTLQPAAGFQDFVIVGGVATDADGTLWVTNTTAAQPLHVRTPDGTWTALPAPRCDGLIPTTALGLLFIDSFGQKWIVVRQATDLRVTRGVIALDTGADPLDTSDDECRFINQTASGPQGFPSVTGITSITEDREGQIWVGTDGGPAFLISSTVAAQDPSTLPNRPIWTDRSVGTFVLSGADINDIATDPANRLWMATNEGAFLVGQEGGFTQVEKFTAEDSPLFSNVVVAVTVDEQTGEVYFATDQGLVSFSGNAVAAAPEKRDLFVYPNPVRLDEEAAPEIFIEGLVAETDVRIVAPHGAVVAQLDARGGRARWDGRDFSSTLVPSGVYLVVAIGQNGEGTAYGKIAIIR